MLIERLFNLQHDVTLFPTQVLLAAMLVWMTKLVCL